MRIDTKDLAIAALLATGVILTDAWITAAITVVLALGFLLGSDNLRAQNRLTMAVFLWGMFTVFSQGNLWYRAQFDLPTIEKEYTYRRAGTEAAVSLSAMGQRSEADGGGGGEFTFLKRLTPEQLKIFPSNMVWTYSIHMPNDSLLVLFMVLRNDLGRDPVFPNANGFFGMKQYRFDITAGEVADIQVDN